MLALSVEPLRAICRDNDARAGAGPDCPTVFLPCLQTFEGKSYLNLEMSFLMHGLKNCTGTPPNARVELKLCSVTTVIGASNGWINVFVYFIGGAAAATGLVQTSIFSKYQNRRNIALACLDVRDGTGLVE